MLDPEQRKLFQQTLTQLGPQFLESFGGFLQPQNVEDYEAMFQKQYGDPAQKAFQQHTIPSIQQQFGDMNAGSSSALNQALAQSASDLSGSLGSQFGQFMKGQQQNQLSALGAFLPMLSQQTFQPTFNQRPGILGNIIGGGGRFLGGLL